MRYLLLILALALAGCDTLVLFKPRPINVGALADACIYPRTLTAQDNASEEAFLRWQKETLYNASKCAGNHAGLVRVLTTAGYITVPAQEALNLIEPAASAAPPPSTQQGAQ